MPELITQLSAATRPLALSLSEQQLQQLARYLALLQAWNQAYNLTAVRDIQAMIPQHILDSLAALPFLTGKHFLDVGTGPGLPGIPLAIARPECEFTLLDSNGKKTRFLQHVKHTLKLDNVHIIQSRIENYHPEIEFDGILSRAFASLADFIKATRPLMGKTTRLIALKGARAADEIAEVRDPTLAISCEDIDIPGLTATRALVIVTKAG